MARPKKIIRTIPLNVGLPEDLYALIKIHLYSEVEERIPFGAQQEFFMRLVRDYFQNRMKEGNLDGVVVVNKVSYNVPFEVEEVFRELVAEAAKLQGSIGQVPVPKAVGSQE
jgi:hypothetical protein